MVCLNVVGVEGLAWGVLVSNGAADALLSRIGAADALRALECAADPLMTCGNAGDAREFLYGAADPLREPLMCTLVGAADALCIPWDAGDPLWRS